MKTLNLKKYIYSKVHSNIIYIIIYESNLKAH